MINYVDDDPFFLSEQPEGGSMEPDATPANYYYYPEGAFSYVEPADNQE